jgi:hypothetical protein
MYQASAPRFANMLKNLSAILDKAQAHADAKKIDPTDTAKGAVARLAGIDIPKYEDTEKTFDELKARIAKTIEFIGTIKPVQIDGSEDKEIVLKLGANEVKFNGMQYLLGHAHPNFYFHVTTAYDILRHNGVELGKRDYLGNP